MTVGDLIIEPFRVHGISTDYDKEVRRLLSLVGLSSDFAQRCPHRPNQGGVLCCRAIALNPG